MEITFNRSDLSTWANFSGDFNPIHFNDDAMKRYGMDGVVVHGMLAMLSLKSNMPQKNWHGPWVEWRAMLKRALPLTSSYVISLKEGGEGVSKFTLADSNGAKNITGTWSEVELDLSDLPTDPDFTINESRVANKILEFAESYPETTALWIFLDALLFSEYMAEHSSTMFAEDLLEFLGVPPQSDGDSPNFMAMHTYHTITSSVELLQRELPKKAPKVQYSVMRKERIVTNDAVYGIIDIPVWVDNSLQMVIEIGLMAKKL